MEQKEIYKVAEVQLSYRPHFKAQDRPQINSSEMAYKVILENWELDLINFIEQAKLVLMNRNNRVLGIVNLSTGGGCSTVMDCRVVFAIALKATASSIILCHNHPSGNLRPSSEDIRMTEMIKQAGKILGIDVHVISNASKYISGELKSTYGEYINKIPGRDKNRLWFNNYFLTLNFNAVKNHSLHLYNSYYINNIAGQKNQLFLDLNYRFRVSQWKTTLELTVYNLLDNKEYAQQTLSSVQLVQTFFELRPRQLMLSTSFKF